MKIARFAVLVGTVALSAGAIAQGLPSQKILTIDVAQAIAQEAMSKCHADGFKVTVTVVDGSNIPKVVMRDDGARWATIDIGRMKATSAMALGSPSGLPPNFPTGTPPPTSILPVMTNAEGGLPIVVAGQLIGAVSVSGAAEDAVCARAGLAKVADKLK
jgi:uncharacterized protein GlcG (DUF336 family)